MEKSPEPVLDTWMERVNTGDLEGILDLYAEKAILIPTFSSRLLNTPEKIRHDFATLGSREDLSVALHRKTLQSQRFQDSTSLLSGIYCWRFSIDGELLSFEARFSYWMDLASNHPILHHHSSQIPRSL